MEEVKKEQGKKTAKAIAGEWMLGLMILIAVLFVGTVGTAPAFELSLRAGVPNDKYIKVTLRHSSLITPFGAGSGSCLKGGAIYGTDAFGWQVYFCSLISVTVDGLYWDSSCTDRVDAYRGNNPVTWEYNEWRWAWDQFRCDVESDSSKVRMSCFKK